MSAANAPAPVAPVQQAGQVPAPPAPPAPVAAPQAARAVAPPAPPAPARAPAVPYAPRGRLPAAPAGPVAPGLSSMLDMVAAAPWSHNEALGFNTFVPNYIMFGYITHCCDNEMLSNDRFNRAHPHWLPIVSQLYISMLFYFRILDCTVASGYAPADHIVLLQHIKAAFDFRRLRIPGPLVPLFSAISVCASGSDILGDIVPVLPTIDATCQATNLFRLNNQTVPNILAILDHINKAYPAGNATTDDYTFGPHTSESLHGTAPTTAAHNDHVIVYNSPTFRFPQHLTPVARRRFSLSSSVRLAFPGAIDAANLTDRTTVLSWPQFLRFQPVPSENHDPAFISWFSNLAALMHDYTTFFAHSASLADIPTSTGAAPLVLGTYATSTDNRHTPDRTSGYVARDGATAAHISLPTLTSLAFTAHIRSPSIPVTHVQLGVLSQVNVCRNATHSDRNRLGTAWDMSPIRDEMTEYDPFTNTPVYVAAFNLETSTARV
jgi:hypothetical protein